ncbi:hypothetical protein [Microbacterium rhizomatis]|uniref:DUF4333 domain-containing protein n=1 Tax=Microbacterium rhizomatis TaxID=1631477 RepID=A0A5J5IZ54_9MICO|nr:hypothetical protein [Microbacterium rhizomatis]KAA9107606.1 hypothetical protein F6B43_09070 [Microbacterium rhizomatis]
MTRRRLAAALLAVAAVILSGCSQVAAIAPVGGSRLAEVRYAALDVLTSADVEILTAPICTQGADETVTCGGTTVDGQAIRAVSTGASPDDVTVTVGSDTLYDGSVQDVLEKAMQR